MVDRIVPATTEADLDAIAARLGLTDAAGVVGEPFRQWVIEDHFVAGRPAWDAAGAQWVGDVTPYERIKMRVLNAAQSHAVASRRARRARLHLRGLRHPVLAALRRAAC